MESVGAIFVYLMLAMLAGFILLYRIFSWWWKSRDDDYDEEL